MADAEVGDDVFGDDPTVITLEQRAAELTGKEAGLFVASGTMGNLVAHMAHVPRGGEIIAEAGSHSPRMRRRGTPWSPAPRSIRGVRARRDGTLDEQEVRDAIFADPADPHLAPTALLVVENTHAVTGGQPLPAAYMDRMGDHRTRATACRSTWTARACSTRRSRFRRPPAALLANVDTATFCLSKGLACPVGSVVVGSPDFIWKARRARKMVGGGMRQVGILAAAGLIALRDGPAGMIERLAEDHANARRLAEALAEMPGIGHLDPAWVRTNFVLFAVMAPGQGRDDRPDRELRARVHRALRAGRRAAGAPTRTARSVPAPTTASRPRTSSGRSRSSATRSWTSGRHRPYLRGAVTDAGPGRRSPRRSSRRTATAPSPGSSRSHFDDADGPQPRAWRPYLGIHAQDHRLPDLSREAYLDGAAAESRFETALEAIDPASLSPATAFEREIALLAARRHPVRCGGPPGLGAARAGRDEIGDALFLLFARPFAPLAGAPGGDHRAPRRGPGALLRGARPAGRPAGPALAAAGARRARARCPAFLETIVAAGPGAWGPRRSATGPPGARRRRPRPPRWPEYAGVAARPAAARRG